jgi:hypothetical protein
MSELEIPKRALDLAVEAWEDTTLLTCREMEALALKAAAPIIVAAAYRKRAGNCPCGDCDALRTDADELDPEGSAS